MEKKKYIVPQTEVIKVLIEGHLLAETRFSTSGNPNDKGTQIIEGNPKSGVEVSAKPHNLWDDVGSSSDDDWNDSWK